MRKRKTTKRANHSPVSIRAASDPFAVVPVVAEGVEARVDAQGLVQIRQFRRSDTGWRRRVQGWLGLRRARRINLDEHGSCFWRLIDGRRDLGAIEESFRQANAMEPEASRKAIIQFIKLLMERHLVDLKIPCTPQPDRGGER